MNFDKQATLVSRLHKASQEGRLDWKVTSEEDRFQVSFPNTTVTIKYNGHQQEYYIGIVNADGEIADVFSDTQLTVGNTLGVEPPYLNWNKTCEEIYLLARRKALGADAALDEVIKSLEP